VNYENGGAPCCDIGDAEEENVILRDRHNGIIVCGRDLSCTAILPSDGIRFGGSLFTHVEREHFALGDCI
jgi:hypothetical protein